MKPYYDLNQIIQGHILDVLSKMLDESIHCIVTSPPYWGLRDYGLPPQIWDARPGCVHEWGDELPHGRRGNRGISGTGGNFHPALDETGQGAGSGTSGQFCIHCNAWLGSLGLEPTPELYIKHITDIFRVLRRVLRKDGTLWLNMGDSYANDTKWGGQSGKKNYTSAAGGYKGQRQKRTTGLKPKDLCMIPAHAALALQADGWWVRSEIIWAKPNPMPESCIDRPTTSHEKVFLLTRSAKYYYDHEAVKEPAVRPGDIQTFGGEKGRNYEPEPSDPNYRHGKEQWGRTIQSGVNGRNLRSVWTIDDGLVEFRKYCESQGVDLKGLMDSFIDGQDEQKTVWTVATQPFPEAHFATFPEKLIEPCIKAGCPEDGVVLDPFFGSGTVGLVARRLSCNFIGIELSPEYIKIAEKRLAQGFLPL